QELLHVEAGVYKQLAQVVQDIRTISQHRLFYNLIEQLLDEGVLGLLTASGELSQVTRSGQPDGFAVVRRVIAHRINGPVPLAGSKAAHRVVLFQAEPERIDDRVTGLAGLRTR